MARDFDGTDDRITVTMTAALSDTDDWTIGMWMLPDLSGGSRTVFSIGNPWTQLIQFNGASANLIAKQRWDGDDPYVIWTPTMDAWQCVFVTYDHSEAVPMEVYAGDQDTAVVNVTSSNLGGTTGRTAGATDAYIGSAVAAAYWDGSVCDLFVVPRLLSLAEMEAFRAGHRSMLLHGAGPVLWMPLRGPTVARDLVSGNTGTITGTTVVEDPPVPCLLGTAC